MEKEFKDKDIIIPKYPGGEELSIGFGSILKINQNIIHHSVSTDYGSSGSPIISQKDFKVIGIHNLRKNDLNKNNGVFMKNIILSIQKMKEEKNIDMTYEYILNISNLELIKTIENDINFKNIILLKDGRLCSIDKFSNIKIYNKQNFNTEIEINNNDKENPGDIACANGNALLFISNDIFKIVYFLDSKDFKIVQSIHLSEKIKITEQEVYPF